MVMKVTAKTQFVVLPNVPNARTMQLVFYANRDLLLLKLDV
jgi:hypothetical protein